MDADTTDDQLSDCCLRCGKELRLGRDNCYLVKVEALADPSPPIVSTEEDPRQEIERLLTKLADLSPQEALDLVHRRLSFYLCGPCYREWIERPAG